MTAGHGGNARQLATRYGFAPDDVLDLSASLHPAAPDIRAVAGAALDELRHYPDDTVARAALAAAIGVPAELLVLTNGGAEAIALVAAHLGAGAVDASEFALYARHLAVVAPDAPRWRSNPNNPLGALAAPDATAAVWDEAFFPVATGAWSRGDAGAFRLGSLTKLWACPGLRLGYVICPDDASAAAIGAARPQWSVNGLAAAAVVPMLAATDLDAMHRVMVELRAALAGVLRAHGFAVAATDANWVLVTDSGDLRERLARRGVFVRDCASFGLPGTVRIAVPDEAGLCRLDTALRSTP